MSAAVWYWREGTTQHGPVTWEKLQSMAVSGKISPSDWVMREGWPDWKLACEANDSSVDMAAVGPPPEPPPLPLPPIAPPVMAQPQIAQPVMMSQAAFAQPVTAAPAPVPPPYGTPMAQPVAQLGVHPPPAVAMVAVTAMDSAALPMTLPLPPLAPQQTLVDLGPPPPSPDGVDQGDVQQLRRALRDERTTGQPARQWNVPAMLALAASVVGLLVLAFEMGLVALGLGGWCLYAASATGNANGKPLALTAVVIGGINVAFRVLAATIDLGLPGV